MIAAYQGWGRDVGGWVMIPKCLSSYVFYLCQNKVAYWKSASQVAWKCSKSSGGGGWVGGWVGSYPLWSHAPTHVEVELGCVNNLLRYINGICQIGIWIGKLSWYWRLCGWGSSLSIWALLRGSLMTWVEILWRFSVYKVTLKISPKPHKSHMQSFGQKLPSPYILSCVES